MFVPREITNLNFDVYFPKIKEILENAVFIAIDAEFTGISSDYLKNNTLFDTSKERYLIVKHNIKDFIMIQFGITGFHFDRDANKYSAYTFVFHVLPRSVGSLERTFLVQSSAMEFLASHDFDFNEFVKTGINYLNKHDEEKLGLRCGITDLNNEIFQPSFHAYKNGPMLSPIDPVNQEEEEAIRNELQRVRDWLASEKKEDAVLEGHVYSSKRRVIDMLINEINSTFPSVLVVTGQNDETDEMVCVYQDTSTSPRARQERVNKLRGFSRMFDLLSELKKPLIGHNPLLDFMIMYNQLYEPLPESYAAYKKQLHALFPQIYDTKYISYELRENVTKPQMWESNELSQLYLYFKVGNGKQITQCSPAVEIVNGLPVVDNEVFHEAGWDSFYTGCCFVKLMHFFALRINLACGMDPKPLTSTQHLHSVRDFKNRINISRANISHLRLDGPEPLSEKPRWIVVELKPGSTIKQDQLLDSVMAKGNLSMDAKMLSNTRVMIAVNSYSASRDVFKMFSDNVNFKVAPYSRLKHSPGVRAILWCGVTVCTTSIGAYFLYKHGPRIVQLLNTTVTN